MSRARIACIGFIFIFGAAIVTTEQDSYWFIVSLLTVAVIGALPEGRK